MNIDAFHENLPKQVVRSSKPLLGRSQPQTRRGGYSLHDGAHRRPRRATRRTRSICAPGTLAATPTTTRFIEVTASTLGNVSPPCPTRTASVPARRTAASSCSSPLAATSYSLKPLVDTLSRPPQDFPTVLQTSKGTVAGVVGARRRSSAVPFHVRWNAPAVSGGSTRRPFGVHISQTSRGGTTPPRCSAPALRGRGVSPLDDTVGVGLCLRLSQQHDPRRGLCHSSFPHALVEWRQIRWCGWLFSLFFLGRRCLQCGQPLRFQPRFLYCS